MTSMYSSIPSEKKKKLVPLRFGRAHVTTHTKSLPQARRYFLTCRLPWSSRAAAGKESSPETAAVPPESKAESVSSSTKVAAEQKVGTGEDVMHTFHIEKERDKRAPSRNNKDAA